MHTVNIFIASAMEMAPWRNIAGNIIREWSDRKEPEGYRIKMLCWEDYAPEFCGLRKQTEYNDQLIKDSQIFIALFQNYCGRYTAEEVSFAKSVIKAENIHFLLFPTNQNRDELIDYINKEGKIDAECNSCSDLERSLGIIINNYLESLPRPRPGQIIDNAKIVYSTIPGDHADELPAIGNMIRSLDYIVESKMNMRCRMVHDSVKALEKCDYYIGFIKHSLSEKDRNEIRYAILNTKANAHPDASIIYSTDKEEILSNDNELKQILYGKEIFCEPFDSLYRVKWNLLIWFLSKALLNVDERCGLEFKDSWISFMGIPLIPANNVGIDFTGCSDETQKLLLLLAYINKKLLMQASDETGEESAPLDFDQLDTKIKDLETTGALAQKIEQDCIGSLQKTLAQIDRRMSALDISEANAEEMFGLNRRREKILTDLFNWAVMPAQEVLRAKLFFVTLHDTFPDKLKEKTYDQDLQYLDIITFADKHEIDSPKIEMARMNYANYLMRRNQIREGLKTYDTARTNLAEQEDGSPLIAKYSLALYMNYIHALLNVRETDAATGLIQEFENKLEKWISMNSLEGKQDIYRICLNAAKLKNQNDVDIDECFALMQRIYDHEFDSNVPEELTDDVFYQFPNTLASTLLDTQKPKNIPYALKILEYSLDKLEHEKRLSADLRLFHIGQITHNISFGYSILRKQEKSREYALRSLEAREKLYAINRYEENLVLIAESLYTICISYVYQKVLSPADLDKGIGYADKAISIYQEQNHEGFLEPETRVYKAKLAKGTLLMRFSKTREEGLSLVTECYQWGLRHPDSSYSDIIISEYHRLVR